LDFAASLPDNEPVAFVLGGFAVGKIEAADHPYVRRPCMLLCIIE
jgi:hypothetical protein